jgi:hypothetical protein
MFVTAVAALVLGMLVIAILLCGLVWFGSDFRRIPSDQIADMEGKFRNGWGIDVPALRVEAAEQDSVFSGSPSRWYRLSVPPESVGAFRDAVVSRYRRDMTRNGPAVVTGDAAAEGMRHGQPSRQPSWWEPEKLPDADAVMIGGKYLHHLFVFSKKTGTVYVFLQGH